MRQMVAAKMPIKKKTIHTDEAIAKFRMYGMRDKERLFEYRRVSKVNIYSMNEFEDYYYSPENNLFYFDTGVNLRVLHINFKKNGSAYVNMRSTENKQVQIRFTKFKKIYGFD